MRNHLKQALLGLAIALLTARHVILAGDADPAIQPKIDAQIKTIQSWVTDPTIINAVKLQNALLPPEYTTMTQDKWKAATIIDPFVRSFEKNEVGQFLKLKKSDLISEAFISDANGIKVGFLGKTTNWSHKGKPKHEVPMTGKTWQGPVETDESTGLQQIQIAVPVWDGEKPIGSLVVGLSITKLTS